MVFSHENSPDINSLQSWAGDGSLDVPVLRLLGRHQCGLWRDTSPVVLNRVNTK
jgi:hypothetical protein